MITQYIQLGDKDWGVLVYYNVGEEDMASVIDSLESLDCTDEDIHAATVTLSKKNTGFTYTNTDYKMTFVCIGHSTNVGQFVDTVVHEAKHVQSHICQYYGIDETSETAAYLIGHLVHKMYKMVSKVLQLYLT